ncbi:protein FMP32, mitochondrial-like isoform X1 [Zingiber officinale]|uniref:Uncharacterized protein n=1 Tax=Zingiber officinale TaxID=94328 RepID=A0A8J5FLA3_ZINOF|nr:protein FMP32, mitochondrial-like isoform X1 [Zingiber officinale]KAG6486568.1 hypothetical protein ZIOFF_055145 [Zingiber officinale]
MSSVSLASLVYRRGGANLGFRCLSLIRPIDFHLSDSSPLLRHFSSQLVKTHVNKVYLADTLALVRKLEAQGLPTKQAEAIASTITETLNNSLGNMTYSFVSKSEMDKIEKIQDSNLSKFKSEMKSTQEHHFSLLQQETRKLQGDIEKVTAGHCLDLNLERGRIRDELTKQAAENTELTNKLDREIQSLRTHLETTKYDAIKYRIGTLVSLSSIGLIIVQIWLLNL